MTGGLIAVAMLGGFCAQGADPAGDDWPCWRGPCGDGLPTVTNIRKEWKGGLEKIWEVSNLSSGTNSATWAAPVIHGNRMIVAGRSNDQDVVFCFDALKGTPLWRQEYATGHDQVQYGNGPRATAAIDGEFVYTFGCMGQLACWKLATGERVWMQALDQLGGQRPFWGYSSSPLIWKDTVIVQGGGSILVVAFDKKTGALAWKSGTGKAGYAAPMIATVEKQPQLIVFTAAGLMAMNPDNGTVLWNYAHVTGADMNCSTPVPVGSNQLLIVSYADLGPGGAALLQLGANGPQELWKSRELSTGHNDPVVVGGYAYAFSGFSLGEKDLRCLDLANGKIKWSTNAVGGPGNVVLVDGMLLCLGNRGKLTLAHPSPEKFDPVADFDAIKGHPVWTVPVLVGDRLYVRQDSHLICYRIKDQVRR